MTLIFTLAYHASEVSELTELTGKRSDVLARAFANVIWPELRAETRAA